MQDIKENRQVSELAFNVVYNSAQMERYNFEGNVSNLNGEILKDLDNETVLRFLELDDTKVTFKMDKEEGTPIMIAHNTLTNEAIEITGLGDHFMALIMAVSEAVKNRELKSKNSRFELLPDKFVKDLNRQLLYIRQDEVAIGEYRDVDFFGRPMEVHHSMVDEHGNYKPCISANIEKSDNKNVINKMAELLHWVNNVAFKDGRDILLDIAKFHARFVQIQPFRDGNKRTARLLTNYLMLMFDMPFVDINEDNKLEYLMSIYYATAEKEEIFRSENAFFKEFDNQMLDKQGVRTDENKYIPLRNFFEKNLIKEHPNKIIEDIFRYDNRKSYHANEVEGKHI